MNHPAQLELGHWAYVPNTATAAQGAVFSRELRQVLVTAGLLCGEGTVGSGPAVSSELVARKFAFLECAAQEEFWVLFLDAKNREIGRRMVSRGTLTASLVHPREVFRAAIAANAAGIVVVHNHPSGNPAPSPEDRVLTDRMREAGTLLMIPVLDHVVIGREGFFSFTKAGW